MCQKVLKDDPFVFDYYLTFMFDVFLTVCSRIAQNEKLHRSMDDELRGNRRLKSMSMCYV